MSDQSGALPTGTLKKRANPSSGWIVMLLSGFLAFVVFLYASLQGQQKHEVLVLDRTYQAGEVINPAAMRVAEVNMHSSVLERLVQVDERQRYNGWVATGPLESGDLLNRSMLRAPGAPNRMRAMAINREQSHAVAGALVAGDRIDVVSQDKQRFIAADLEVLSAGVPGGGGGIRGGGSDDYTIVVAVTPVQAEKLSIELGSGKFDIIRSTGSRSTADYNAEFCALLQEGLADPEATLDIPACGGEVVASADSTATTTTPSQ